MTFAYICILGLFVLFHWQGWPSGHQNRPTQSTEEWIYLIPKDKAVYAIPRVFFKGPICHENPGTPRNPPKKNTRGDLIFRLYNKWISYILWSDLTASLSKMMCWKTVFVWDFGHFLRGELLTTLIFGGFLLTYLAAWYLCGWSIFTSKLHFGGLWCGLLPTSTRISTKVHLDTLPKTNSLPLKINGWKMNFVLGWPILFGRTVSFTKCRSRLIPHWRFRTPQLVSVISEPSAVIVMVV